MKARHIPNLITGCRILLVAPILWLLLEERFGAALALFVVAGVSDAVDGFLAKHYGWTSNLGGILDPLADKLLLLGVVLVLGWMGELPTWLVVLVVLRDLLIVGGALGYHYLIEPFTAEPTLISKLNTLMQLLLVLTVMFSKGVAVVPGWLTATLLITVALTTVLSGGHYVWTWGLRALQRGRQHNAI